MDIVNSYYTHTIVSTHASVITPTIDATPTKVRTPTIVSTATVVRTHATAITPTTPLEQWDRNVLLLIPGNNNKYSNKEYNRHR